MITLEEAKTHLRVDHAEDDADISLKLFMANAIVKSYAGEVEAITEAATAAEAAAVTDAEIAAAANTSAKSFEANAVADAAVLMVLGELYANREAGGDPLSPTVRAILSHLRKPVLA